MLAWGSHHETMQRPCTAEWRLWIATCMCAHTVISKTSGNELKNYEYNCKCEALLIVVHCTQGLIWGFPKSVYIHLSNTVTMCASLRLQLVWLRFQEWMYIQLELHVSYSWSCELAACMTMNYTTYMYMYSMELSEHTSNAEDPSKKH